MEVSISNVKKKKGDGQEKLPTLEQPSDTGVRIGDLAASNAMQQEQDAPSSSVNVGKKKKKKTKVNQNELLGPQAVRFEFHFPEEVWLMILDLVSDEDKINCCQAFPYLDRILTPRKPVFLAEQVLPLMDKWLSHNELLSSREVCTKWCSGVERLMYSRRSPLPDTHKKVLHTFRFEEHVDEFMEKFAGHSRSPFIDGSIFIIGGNGVDEPNYEDYLEGLLNLFRRFGKYIKIMDITELLPGVTLLTWYRFIQEALMNTPNLRQLRIFEPVLLDEPEGFAPEAGEPEEPVELQENINELNSYVLQNPMPFIQSLDVLCINNGHNTNQSFENIHLMMIQPYAGQLKTLSVDTYNWKDHYAPGLVNLTLLQLTCVHSDAVLERLTRLPKTPLKSLTLEIVNDLSVPAWLRVLKHFPMLHAAVLYFESANEKFTNGQDIASLEHQHHLQVPSIRSLEIHYGGIASFNFLRLFSGLRRLIVNVHEEMDIDVSADGEGDGDLQLYKIVRDGKMYESNIWEMIPSLKYFKISTEDDTVISGTREGYNEECKTKTKPVLKPNV